MRLRSLLLTLAMTAAAAGCSAADGVGGAGAGGGGDGGASATAGSTGSGTAVMASTATSGAGGGSSSATVGAGGGGAPLVCMDVAECGNFGSGCVNCAIESSCAEPYQKCFADAQCKAYAMCIAPCTPKGVDCLQACATQYPMGAMEYGTLTHCVFCGDCATQCQHPNDVCP